MINFILCIIGFLLGYFISKCYNAYMYWCPSKDVKEAFDRLEQNRKKEDNDD